MSRSRPPAERVPDPFALTIGAGEPSKLIPLQEAAQWLKVNPVTLYRYLKAGRLTRYQIAMDRRTYLSREELQRLLQPVALPHYRRRPSDRPAKAKR